jgi:hypothetical protein
MVTPNILVEWCRMIVVEWIVSQIKNPCAFFIVFHQSPNALKMLHTDLFRDHSSVAISAVSTRAILSNNIQFERG